MNVSRRNFLKGAAAGTAGSTAHGPSAPAGYPFHGTHQAGVLTPGPARKQACACFAAFDTTAGGRASLAGLMRTLTSRARFLTSGGTPPDLGVGQPPADSDVLGPAVPADGLTVTVSVGSSLFDGRYGLGARTPRKLTPMRAFPNDSPDPAWLHGDLLLQLCANHPDTIHHAIRDITRHTRGAMQLRWKMAGYGSPPRPSGRRGTCSGSRTAPPTPPAVSRAAWSGWTTPPSPPGPRAGPTRWYG